MIQIIETDDTIEIRDISDHSFRATVIPYSLPVWADDTAISVCMDDSSGYIRDMDWR